MRKSSNYCPFFLENNLHLSAVLVVLWGALMALARRCCSGGAGCWAALLVLEGALAIACTSGAQPDAGGHW